MVEYPVSKNEYQLNKISIKTGILLAIRPILGINEHSM